jgi:hypothetical protein
MKIAKILFLLLFFSMFLSSCKKDYPEDIPKWVKEKIKYCDKKKNNCGIVEKLIIDEYSYQGNIYYRLYIGYPPPRQNDFYDYEGNFICSEIYNISCSYFYNGNLIFIRRIWQEK